MFCKNCGTKLDDGDAFCSNCGAPVGTSAKNHESFQGNVSHAALNEIPIVTFFSYYMKKPLSFFEKYKKEDSIKISVPLLILLPILYGFISIVYSKCVVKAAVSLIKKIPEFMSKMGLISAQDVVRAKNEMMMSDSWLNIDQKISGLIDKKDIFFSGFGNLLIIIIVTVVLLAALNALMFKNKMSARDIMIISTSSYIPLVLSFVAASIGTLISILFGLCILVSGYILSFITLYNGIKQLSGENEDKVFAVMIILFVISSAVVSFGFIMECESSMITIGKAFNTVKDFL